jgi:DegV family protein with EDD domain
MSATTPVMMPAPVLMLDGLQLGRLLRAGIQKLLADREHLNKINVFPVADGDTGTNMALTMYAVRNALRQSPDPHAGATLTRVADAALDGARGNSGAILAQFLLGLGDSAGPLPVLTTDQFATALNAGATYARDSLSEPREGTVLTVISEFAREAVRLATTQKLDDFVALFKQGLSVARQSLVGTARQLEELRDAGVVDAGAQGFVDLLEGMTSHIEQGVDADPAELELAATLDDSQAAGESKDLAFRYCTECLIAGEHIDRRKLREQLSAIGGSLVIAGTQRKAKVHVHANEPAEVFRIASTYGVVSAEKADDMHRQQHAAHERSARVAVITDSVADIPDEALERLDIHFIPLRVHFGEHSYLDKIGLTPEQFVEELVRNPLHPTTSQPPAGDFRRQFEFLTSHAAGVVSINVTSRASGTFGSASTAAQRIQSAHPVAVIDSMNASIGQGLVVTYAAELAAQGLPLNEIVARTRAILPRTKTYGVVGSLDYAVRGGRVTPAQRSIANFLQILPVLTNRSDGRIAPGGVLLGRKDPRGKYARFVLRRMDRNRHYRLGIGHANAPAEGQHLLDLIRNAHPHIDSAFLMPVGSTLSVHGGPGTLVVGIQEMGGD